MKRFWIFLCLFPVFAFAQRTPETIQQEVERLRRIYDIVLDPIEQIPSEPTARSLASGNWGYQFLQADQATTWIRQKMKRKVYVFIFDTASDYDHPDLDGVVERDMASNWTNDGTTKDVHGHSTHVAGTIAGKHPSLPLGIATLLREKNLIRLVPVEVLNDSGSGNFSWIDAALVHVNKQAAELIGQGSGVVYNFSLGGGSACPTSTAQRLADAMKLGVIVCSAAGNSGTRGVGCPAKNSTAAIAAVDQSGAKASFSTTGPEVRYAAPGVGIFSTLPGGRYAEWSGTSMATPHQSAISAIMLSCYPENTTSELLAHMDRKATDLGQSGRDEAFGFGVTKLLALFADKPGNDPTPPPAPDPDPEPPAPEPQPLRTIAISVPDTFKVIWSRGTENAWREAYLSFSVDYPSTLEGAQATLVISQTVRDHFTRRGYILRPQDDDYDLIYWTAFFFELVERGKLGRDVKISEAQLHVNGVTIKQGYPTKSAKPAGAMKAKRRGDVFQIFTGN